MNEEFRMMPLDKKVTFLVENLRSLPDDMAEEGVRTLAEAGETEYAAVLARDKGMIDSAIQILVDAGDYLWAALIAKNSGRAEESDRLYREGLAYYTDMEMFGRALSAATALRLPEGEVDALFRRGIEVESRGVSLAASRGMIESAMDSLEIALIGREDELSLQIMNALKEEKSRIEERDERKEND
ncbi:MAG TPA: hypothetical protein VLY86_00680 [Methanothrix sp.]|nr:hypothetical protein [Methanothrix sp.]